MFKVGDRVRWARLHNGYGRVGILEGDCDIGDCGVVVSTARNLYDDRVEITVLFPAHRTRYNVPSQERQWFFYDDMLDLEKPAVPRPTDRPVFDYRVIDKHCSRKEWSELTLQEFTKGEYPDGVFVFAEGRAKAVGMDGEHITILDVTNG